MTFILLVKIENVLIFLAKRHCVLVMPSYTLATDGRDPNGKSYILLF